MAEKIDVEKAKELRLSGMSLQDVATAMGCSLAWCKVNLKGIKPQNKDKPIVEEVRKRGRTTHGVTVAEIKFFVRGVYPELKGKDLEKKVSDIKRTSRRDNPDVLIRPYWMAAETPRDAVTMMLEYANEVWQFKEHLADNFRRAFDMDASAHNSVIHALTAMSAGDHSKLLPQGLLSYGYQLDKIQTELESRNAGNAPQAIDLTMYSHIIDDRELVGLDDLDLDF